MKQAEAVGNENAIALYKKACTEICQQYNWTQDAAKSAWGISWINEYYSSLPNPRLINSGWLIEDFENTDEKKNELGNLRNTIAKYFAPGNNPTDWYVIAAGDGDSMSEWLKGSKLKTYREYIPQELQHKIERFPPEIRQPVTEFLKIQKRMGPATHSALSRSLLDFANQLVPYLTESRYAGRLIYCGGDDVLAYTNLWEWDKWLWDLRQCFQGQEDPQGEFESKGDYWQFGKQETGNRERGNNKLPSRPLFTLGSSATISFGIVISHHSVPLAIALENLWLAEEEAKEHYFIDEFDKNQRIHKDAVQVRTIYGNGNILKATAKFSVFNCWQNLIEFAQQHCELESAIFEQAAEIWLQHPAPQTAISQWTRAFCNRRNVFKNNLEFRNLFADRLSDLLSKLLTYSSKDLKDREIKNWLKLAAFTLRNRDVSNKIKVRN